MIKGAMDIHAENISIAFMDWTYDLFYYRNDQDIWFDRSGEGIANSTKELFQIFKQKICKKESPDVSVNSTQ